MEDHQAVHPRDPDAGPLAKARFVERMTLLRAGLGQRLGYFPRMNWRVMEEPWTPGQADELREHLARPLDEAAAATV
jgi:hypothetical protein